MENYGHKNEANTEAGEILCVACGFCCDGTLFQTADVEENENTKIHSRLKIEVNEEKTLFFQPCHLHDSVVGCTVYASERPIICGEFRCRLLKQLQKGEISEKEAMDIVAETKAIKEQIVLEINKRASFIKPTSFSEKYSLVFSSNKHDAGFKRANAKVLLSYACLQQMLNKFRL